MRVKYRPWAEPYLDEHPEVQMGLKEVSSLKDFELEIGSGKGAFIINLAKRNPEKFYLAIERNVSCAGAIAKALVDEQITNVKLMRIDGELVLDALKDESVDILYLNFSDPWPKKRHTKRRLTYDRLIDKYARVIKKGGLLRFKTDNDELYRFSKETFINPSFEINVDEYDYDGNDVDDEKSEYEIKKRELGLKIHRIILKRI